jgi:hypothetical protein
MFHAKFGGTPDNLPELVVEVRVPRGPSAVEGNRELLVVLKALLPHPKTGEHIDYCKAFEKSNTESTDEEAKQAKGANGVRETTRRASGGGRELTLMR